MLSACLSSEQESRELAASSDNDKIESMIDKLPWLKESNISVCRCM